MFKSLLVIWNTFRAIVVAAFVVMAIVALGFLLGLIGAVLSWVIVIGLIACVIYVVFTEKPPPQ